MNQPINRLAEAFMVKLPHGVQIERCCHLANVARCTRASAAPLGDIGPRTEGVQRPPPDQPDERAVRIVGERAARCRDRGRVGHVDVEEELLDVQRDHVVGRRWKRCVARRR